METSNLTVNVPDVVYTYVGFSRADVFPSPNDQFQLSGNPVLKSVNITGSGTFPDTGLAVNCAFGLGPLPGVGGWVMAGDVATTVAKEVGNVVLFTVVLFTELQSPHGMDVVLTVLVTGTIVRVCGAVVAGTGVGTWLIHPVTRITMPNIVRIIAVFGFIPGVYGSDVIIFFFLCQRNDWYQAWDFPGSTTWQSLHSSHSNSRVE